MRRHLLPPAVIALLALATVACSGTGAAPSGTIGPGGNVVTYAGEEALAAPAVEAQTLDGDTLALADLDGPVLINFWASWCGPCRREAPHLAAVDEVYGARGLHVVGVNVKDTEVNARTFERDNGVAYPSWFDDGAVIAASFGGIGPSMLPTTILLDAEHRVVAQFYGAVTGRELAPHLDAVAPPEPGDATQRSTGDATGDIGDGP